MAFVNGALFSFWTAVVLNLLSGVLSGIAMYYLWRRGDHEWDSDRADEVDTGAALTAAAAGDAGPGAVKPRLA